MVTNLGVIPSERQAISNSLRHPKVIEIGISSSAFKVISFVSFRNQGLFLLAMTISSSLSEESMVNRWGSSNETLVIPKSDIPLRMLYICSLTDSSCNSKDIKGYFS